MAPLVKRTWAVRGQRPSLLQKGRHREKVSLAAALWLSPEWDRLGLIYETIVDAYYNNEKVAGFLGLLLRELPTRLVVLWDRGNMHSGDPIRAQVERFRPRLSLEQLPPYAPMIDPVEPIFSWLKYGRLSNYAPHNAHELDRRLRAELDPLCDDQERLTNLWHASDLPLPQVLKQRHYFSDEL